MDIKKNSICIRMTHILESEGRLYPEIFKKELSQLSVELSAGSIKRYIKAIRDSFSDFFDYSVVIYYDFKEKCYLMEKS